MVTVKMGVVTSIIIMLLGGREGGRMHTHHCVCVIVPHDVLHCSMELDCVDPFISKYVD